MKDQVGWLPTVPGQLQVHRFIHGHFQNTIDPGHGNIIDQAQVVARGRYRGRVLRYRLGFRQEQPILAHFLGQQISVELPILPVPLLVKIVSGLPGRGHAGPVPTLGLQITQGLGRFRRQNRIIVRGSRELSQRRGG